MIPREGEESLFSVRTEGAQALIPYSSAPKESLLKAKGWLTGGVGAAAGALTAVWGRGNFIQELLVIGVAGGIGIPLLLLSLVLFYFSRRERGPKLRPAAVFLWMLTSLVAFQLISIPGGRFFHHRDIQEAKQFCESLVPRLEAYRLQKGQYPSSLEEAAIPSRSLPRLLQATRFYWSDGSTCGFNFADPAEMMSGWDYACETRQWRRWY